MRGVYLSSAAQLGYAKIALALPLRAIFSKITRAGLRNSGRSLVRNSGRSLVVDSENRYNRRVMNDDFLLRSMMVRPQLR